MNQSQFSSGIYEKIYLNPISLKFQKDQEHLEKPFNEDFFKGSLRIIRLASIFGMLIYSLFGILDAYLIPEKKNIFWMLRYAFFLPLSLGLLSFTYTSLFKKIWQQVIGFWVVLAGAVIIIMIVIATPPVNFSYYAGLILVFMMCYTVMRLQFIWGTIAGWILVILYEIAAVFLSDTPNSILINNNFFFIGANLIGMIACYAIEYNTRRDFFLKYLLDAEREKVRKAKDILKEKVEERTSQLLQAQKMDSIGTLAGGVAHDFNNLLTVINGYSELAIKRIKNGKTENLRETIEPVLEAGKKAAELTSQLLAFSRKQVFSPSILDLSKIIKNMNKMLLRLIDEDVIIQILRSEDVLKIKADKTQLEQILINLIVNARDAVCTKTHSESKKVIDIKTGNIFLNEKFTQKNPGSRTGQFVYMSISDNGIGMDSQTKKKIFEPFFTTKNKFKGTGLGLATVYGIVKQNNGYISVDSEPGKGSIFTVYWPVTEEKEIIREKAYIENNDLTGSENILLVEDEEDVRTYALKALESYGYKVYTAENGIMALKLAKIYEYKFDIIVTDLIMPKLNGKDFIEIIKKIIPEIKNIFISGYTDDQILNEGKLEEGLNFIQKPFSPMVLADQVRKVLDNK